MKLDLNGHKVEANANSRAYLTTRSAKLTITDTKGGGLVIGGGNSSNGGVFLANDTSIVTIYGGTFEGGEAE